MSIEMSIPSQSCHVHERFAFMDSVACKSIHKDFYPCLRLPCHKVESYLESWSMIQLVLYQSSRHCDFGPSFDHRRQKTIQYRNLLFYDFVLRGFNRVTR